MVTIEMNTIGEYISRPLLNVVISDNSDFNNSITIIALVDTGADISFIDSQLLNQLNFFRKNDEYEGQKQAVYKVYFSIDDLIPSFYIFTGSRSLINNNPKDKKFDMLLGRDFLKYCKMTYLGTENLISIEWVGLL